MLPEEQNQKFETFSASAKKNGILKPKSTHLIYLAAAMAIGCYP